LRGWHRNAWCCYLSSRAGWWWTKKAGIENHTHRNWPDDGNRDEKKGWTISGSALKGTDMAWRGDGSETGRKGEEY